MLKFPRNKVAITPIFDPDMSPTGLLHIPDMAKERCDQGIVKYVGGDCKWVKSGMYVIFSGYTGTLVSIQGEGRLIIMPEEFVVCEIEGEEIDNIPVPGLYYRTKFNKEAAIAEMVGILNEVMSKGVEDIESDVWSMDIQGIAKKLIEMGVFGPLAAPYYQADYENIFTYISMAVQESSFFRRIVVKQDKPKLEEANAEGYN